MALMMKKHDADGSNAAFLVKFVNADGSWEETAKAGESILEVARRCGAPVHTLCNGIGACVQCKIKVIENPDSLSRPEVLEKDRIGNIFHLTGERLGCQAKIYGDVTVEPLAVRLPKKRRRGPIRSR